MNVPSSLSKVSVNALVPPPPRELAGKKVDAVEVVGRTDRLPVPSPREKPPGNASDVMLEIGKTDVAKLGVGETEGVENESVPFGGTGVANAVCEPRALTRSEPTNNAFFISLLRLRNPGGGTVCLGKLPSNTCAKQEY